MDQLLGTKVLNCCHCAVVTEGPRDVHVCFSRVFTRAVHVCYSHELFTCLVRVYSRVLFTCVTTR